MKMLKDEQGWSYVEILMAALLMSIIAVPIISGFSQTALNFRFAYYQYQAALMAANAVTEGKRELRNLWQTGDLSGFYNFTQTQEFNELYRTDTFQYVIEFELLEEENFAPPSFLTKIENAGPAATEIYITSDNEAIFISKSATCINLKLNNEADQTFFFNIYLEEGLLPQDVNIIFGNNRGGIIVSYHKIRRSGRGLLTVEVYNTYGRMLYSISSPVALQ